MSRGSSYRKTFRHLTEHAKATISCSRGTKLALYIVEALMRGLKPFVLFTIANILCSVTLANGFLCASLFDSGHTRAIGLDKFTESYKINLESLIPYLENALATKGYAHLPTHGFVPAEIRRSIFESLKNLDGFEFRGYIWEAKNPKYGGSRWDLNVLPERENDMSIPRNFDMRDYARLPQIIAAETLKPLEEAIFNLAKNFENILNNAHKSETHRLTLTSIYTRYNSNEDLSINELSRFHKDGKPTDAPRYRVGFSIFGTGTSINRGGGETLLHSGDMIRPNDGDITVISVGGKNATWHVAGGGPRLSLFADYEWVPISKPD